jgi:hypothetical protein
MDPERKAFTSPDFGANDAQPASGLGFTGDGGGFTAAPEPEEAAKPEQEKTQPVSDSPEAE